MEKHASWIEELKEQYTDIVGWLEVPGTNIDYPVLQGEDNNYYVKHNYKQEYAFDGSIFLHNEKVIDINMLNLKGKHNIYNVMCAICFAYIYKIKINKIRNVLINSSFLLSSFNISSVVLFCIS